MSYCRLSKNCDVYVWYGVAGTSKDVSSEPHRYCITTAWDKRIQRGGELTQNFVVEGPLQAVNVLMGLRRDGLKVPSAAIKRLAREARRGQ